MRLFASVKRALADRKTRRNLLLGAIAIGVVKLAFGLGAAFLAWRALSG